MADRTGLEPATSGVTGRHSNQLNYRSTLMTIREVTLADRTGLEPATSGVTGRHSNQLNYRSNVYNSTCPAITKVMVGGTGFEPVTPSL